MRNIVFIVYFFSLAQGYGQVYQPVYQSNNCPCGQGDFPTVVEQTIISRWSVTGDGTTGNPINFTNDIASPNPNANYITDISGGRRWMPGGGTVWWLEQQIAHGFIAGDHISWNGTAWEYATTLCETCIHEGIVGYVEGANEFWIVIPGELINIPAHGFTPWQWQFAQDVPQLLLPIPDKNWDDVVCIATDHPDWMIYVTDRAKKLDVGQNLNFILQGSIAEPVRLEIDTIGGSPVGILERTDQSGFMSIYLNDTTYLVLRDTVTLTAGTDTVPQLNYVYMVVDAGAPTLESSVISWPDSLYAPVATVVLQGLDSIMTNGPMKNHVHNHYVMDPVRKGIVVEDGQFDRKNIRVDSWGTITATVTTNVGNLDDLHFSSDEIILSNVKQDTFHAKNTATGDLVYVRNDKDWSYRPISNLNEVLYDLVGNSVDEKNYSLVVWGVVSQDSIQNKYFVNLPEASHENAFFAADYANYSIPVEYKGSGFLISRLDLHYSSSGDSTITVVKNNVLLGSDPTEIRKSQALSFVIDTSQFLVKTFISDSGTFDADHPLDSLIIEGKVGINTSISNDTLTVAVDSFPNLISTVISDAGTFVVDHPLDSLIVMGDGNISTSISNDTLTISLDSINIDYVIEAEDATTPTTAIMYRILPIDVSGGIHTVNPPSGTPVVGNWFAVVDSRSNATANNITVDFTTAGDNYYGAAANAVMATDGDFWTFIYISAAVGWVRKQ